jgi:hypothetical protein
VVGSFAVSQVADSRVLEHESSRLGRWLHARRMRFSVWIAALEAIVVAIFHDVSRWTVIGLAIVAAAVWFAAGRDTRSDSLRQLTWIFAASQLLAVIAVILAFILFWTAIVAAVILAVVGLGYLWRDRR